MCLQKSALFSVSSNLIWYNIVMKKVSFFTLDTLVIITTALIFGIALGLICPSQYSMAFRTTIHNIYIKLHPESKKDTRTIIMEKATKDIPNLPQNSIFEEPQPKENNFILYLKKIFSKKQDDTPKSIHDVILH